MATIKELEKLIDDENEMLDKMVEAIGRAERTYETSLAEGRIKIQTWLDEISRIKEVQNMKN